MAPTNTDSVLEAEASETSPLLHNSKFDSHDQVDEAARTANTDLFPQENAVPLVEEPSTGKLLMVMCSIWLGTFLAALDSTIVATLSAPISTSFSSLSLLSWLASAYFIAQAALQPLSGRLTDIYSRRNGLVWANIFFAAGNLICGLARKEWVLIFGRVIAGMGGGGLTAISTFVASDLVPLRRRGVWQGFGNISYGIGAGLGGVFGGWINDTWGWRNAFLIQVPLTIISGIIVFFTVRIPVKHSEKAAIKRVDFLGAATLITTLVLLLLGLNSGGNIVPWNHPLIYSTLSLSFISLMLFIYVENNIASEPVIPVKLLLDRTVLSACLTNWFITMSVFAILFYGPIYFQVEGLSPTEAGVRLIPQSVGTALGSIATGLLMRWTGRYYGLNIGIQVIFIAACLIISTFTLDTPAWEPYLAFLMSGTGYSGMLTTTLLALISAVDHEHQAVITSASYAFRSTGSVIGITIASAVFQNVLKMKLWATLGGRQGAADIIGRLRDSLDEIGKLPLELRVEVRGAYMDALRGVFLTTLGLSVMGALVSLAMREHKLHSNLERR
jgi:MFS family permease